MFEPKATAPHLDSTKRRNTLAEHMFSASPPTTDVRRLHRNDRFVPKAVVATLARRRSG